MTLLDQIKAKYLEVRKARNADASASLSTLLGEIETLAKAGKGEITDAVVVTVVKKFMKNLDETITAFVDRLPTSTNDPADDKAKFDALRLERALYETFLPKQLTENEIGHLLDGMIAAGAKDVGDCMKRLKADYAGQYDGAVASKLLKAKFA